MTKPSPTTSQPVTGQSTSAAEAFSSAPVAAPVASLGQPERCVLLQAEINVCRGVAPLPVERIRLDRNEEFDLQRPNHRDPLAAAARSLKSSTRARQTMLYFLLFMIFMMHNTIGHAEASTADDKTPDEVRSFIEEGMRVIANESGDLNGNSRLDYVLVLETEHEKVNEYEQTGRQRVLLILVRRPDGTLEVAKRNDKIVDCSTCGGSSITDSFQGVSTGPKTFTVHAHGGSAWRSVTEFKFDYSRIDQTWQLVEATESSFWSGDPEETFKTKVYVPPDGNCSPGWHFWVARAARI